MLAVMAGLAAACAWAVHDLLVRKLGQEAPILPMMLVVLASGAAVLAVPMLIWADWSALTPRALGLTAAAGGAYVLGMGGLYRAFSLAPVRLVAPILGAFPMISLGFAAMGGKPVSLIEVLAVVAIVGGIAIVALTGRDEGTRIDRPGTAILWSLAGTVGFASTFWLAQEAARLGGEAAAILLPRLVALVVLAALCLTLRAPVHQVRPQVPVLAMVGLLDAVAIGLVTASASLPNPEYAAIASSLFGVLTILLAWKFLKEQVVARQWLGIATVFAGIAVLSAQ